MRWSLSPLEERWEAIEACEARYRGTTLRASTDEIGLARLRSGLELVRVGRPQRPEMAAWRYGPQLLSRRRRAMALIAARAVKEEFDATVSEGPGLDGLIALMNPIYLIGFVVAKQTMGGINLLRERRPVTIVRDGPRVYTVRRSHAARARLSSNADGMYELRVGCDGGFATLLGEEARSMLGTLLVVANDVGASQRDIGLAVAKIEHAGGAEAWIRSSAVRAKGSSLSQLGTLQRLALEMAVHEEQERHALEGELATLAAAWRDAEEIAAIADGLLVSSHVNDGLARLKLGRRGITLDE